MKRSDELTQKLGRSLQLTKDAAAKPIPADHQPEKAEVSVVKIGEIQETFGKSSKPKSAKRERAEPMTVSLYPSDVKKADAIVIYMMQREKRLSRSDAVKLALRAANIGPELEIAYQELRAQDGRGTNR